MNTLDKVYDLTIDIKNIDVKYNSYAKFFDDDRETSVIRIKLLNDKTPIDLEGCTVEAEFILANNTYHDETCKIINTNEGIVELQLCQECLVVGKNTVRLSILKENEIANTPVITYEVKKGLYSDNPNFNDDPLTPVLSQMLLDVKVTKANQIELQEKYEKSLPKIEGKIKEVESLINRVDTAIASGTQDLEVKEARVDKNGKSYAKLGDRLDEVDSQLEHITKYDLKTNNITELIHVLNSCTPNATINLLPNEIYVSSEQININKNVNINFNGSVIKCNNIGTYPNNNVIKITPNIKSRIEITQKEYEQGSNFIELNTQNLIEGQRIYIEMGTSEYDSSCPSSWCGYSTITSVTDNGIFVDLFAKEKINGYKGNINADPVNDKKKDYIYIFENNIDSIVLNDLNIETKKGLTTLSTLCFDKCDNIILKNAKSKNSSIFLYLTQCKNLSSDNATVEVGYNNTNESGRFIGCVNTENINIKNSIIHSDLNYSIIMAEACSDLFIENMKYFNRCNTTTQHTNTGIAYYSGKSNIIFKNIEVYYSDANEKIFTMVPYSFQNCNIKINNIKTNCLKLRNLYLSVIDNISLNNLSIKNKRNKLYQYKVKNETTNVKLFAIDLYKNLYSEIGINIKNKESFNSCGIINDKGAGVSLNKENVTNNIEKKYQFDLNGFNEIDINRKIDFYIEPNSVCEFEIYVEYFEV